MLITDTKIPKTPATRATDKHTVASYFARTHLDNALYAGGNEQDILAQAGLTRELLKQPRARILPRQLAALVRISWQLSGDELLGLTQQKVKLGVFALLAERLIRCKTLEEVLKQMADFYNLIGDQLRCDIQQQGSQVHFIVNANFKEHSHNPTPHSLLTELLLLVCHRFPSWLVGQVIPLTQVRVQHAKPAHVEEYRLMFPCPCVFSCDNTALVFDAAHLMLPVIQNPNELEQYLSEMPFQWFKKQSYLDTLSAQVMRMLEEAPKEKDTKIDSIAARLNMTSRTLRRKLTAEGSRFQQIKDNIRRDQAINLIEDSRLTLAQIASQLGFTEPATFTRAFKQWTGVPPSIYRNHSTTQLQPPPPLTKPAQGNAVKAGIHPD